MCEQEMLGVQELDKQQGRGQMGACSPLIWDEGQAERLLAGSPVLQLIKERAKVWPSAPPLPPPPPGLASCS